MQKSISTLLLILEDSINSTAMVHHCIEIVRNTINHLNPGQITVLTTDQPVYALGKQVQWTYDKNYKDVTWLMGTLHIEMALINAIGNWIQGSGWVEAFVQANITTADRIDSFLNGSKVKTTHHAHQLSWAVLIKLSHSAFDDQSKFNNYVDWRNHLMEKNANANYWFQLIQLETLLFTFIKSLRDADFELFLDCLKSINKWMFSLDHLHYARWLTVFIKDLEQLNPEVLNAFKKGCFIVKPSKRIFSNIGIDQAYEPNNKLVEIHGGAIGILVNPNALLRWAVSGPVVAELCRYEKLSEMSSKNHHENTQAFEFNFRKDFKSFYTSFYNQQFKTNSLK